MPTFGFNTANLCTFAVFCGVMVGCSPQEEIRTYRAPKEDLHTTKEIADQFTPLPDFKVPDSWRKARLDQFSSAAWEAGDGDETARITITHTGGGGAGLDAQLNRWRKQVGLPPLDQQEWMQQLEPIDMGDGRAILVQMENNGDAIAGALALVADGMWFFKMRGPAATVKKELPRLKKFCGTVKFVTE